MTALEPWQITRGASQSLVCQAWLTDDGQLATDHCRPFPAKIHFDAVVPPFRKRGAPRAAAPTRDVITVGRRVWTVMYVRHPRARNYVLRVGEDGGLRVTIPRGGSRAGADRFARLKADWIERERYRRTLRQAPDPAETRRLRDIAARELPARLLELAASLGHTVAGVTVRDQRSRWGSCSHAGRISLNWRLVQAPPTVRDYVLLHELTHLAEGNHSRRFWKNSRRCARGTGGARLAPRVAAPERT